MYAVKGGLEFNDGRGFQLFTVLVTPELTKVEVTPVEPVQLPIADEVEAIVREAMDSDVDPNLIDDRFAQDLDGPWHREGYPWSQPAPGWTGVPHADAALRNINKHDDRLNCTATEPTQP